MQADPVAGMNDMGVSSETNDALLSLNALTYRKTYPLAVASSTQWRVFRALRSGYTQGDTIIVDVTPGAAFFDPAVSYLQFEFANTGGGAADLDAEIGFYPGLLSEVVVRARSGLEISRSTSHGLGQTLTAQYTYSTNYMLTIGSTYGTLDAYELKANATQVVCIPLPDVSPFFGTPTLIPSQLGQIRLEITIAPFIEMFTQNNNFGALSINNVQVWTKCYDLADTALKRLSFIASQTGLVLPYVDRYLTRSIPVGGVINTNSLKAASRAISAFVCPMRDRAVSRDGTNGMSNLATFPWFPTNTFQFSLGSQFLTAEPVRGVEPGMVQANHAFGMWGRAKDGVNNNVTSLQFLGGNAVRGCAIMACNLERSHVLQLNGMAVSSSRPLLVTGQMAANPTSLFYYLNFLRLLYVFSDSNCSIKE